MPGGYINAKALAHLHVACVCIWASYADYRNFTIGLIGLIWPIEKTAQEQYIGTSAGAHAAQAMKRVQEPMLGCCVGASVKLMV